MAALTLAQLKSPQSKESIYATALAVAKVLGLPVTTWQPGDPTRSLYHVEAEELSILEQAVCGFIGSGFLDYATGEWLILRAYDAFNVNAVRATYATAQEVLTNEKGGLYQIEPGDITFRSVDDHTYRNTSGGTLAPFGTLTLDIMADEPGSESSAAPGEINAMVTTLLGVTCTNPTAATGLDDESAESIRRRCRDKLASLSPNGPADAYVYVATEPALTGTTNVTRARAYGDSDTGDVTLYLASPSGGVLEADRALVEVAEHKHAVPLTITLTTLSAVAVPVAISYQLWLYDTANIGEAEAAATIADALGRMFAERPIGGDIIPPATTGALYLTLIESVIRSVYGTHAFRVNVTSPVGDVQLTNAQVAVLAVPTATITIVEAP